MLNDDAKNLFSSFPLPIRFASHPSMLLIPHKELTNSLTVALLFYANRVTLPVVVAECKDIKWSHNLFEQTSVGPGCRLAKKRLFRLQRFEKVQ
jgi:hypothetical protein